jgi:two-component system, NarL family, invasion response regulator UvrY
MTTVRIAIVDDHPLLRLGFAHEIEHLGGLETVIQAGNGEEYIQASAGRPVDIAVVDLIMPGMDGFATIAWIREHQPRTKAIAFSYDPHPIAVQRALRAGALAVLNKECFTEDIEKALHDVHRSGFHHNQLTAGHLLGKRKSDPADRSKVAHTGVKLTPREFELLTLLCASGKLDYRSIALRMGIRLSTVDTHRKSVMNKTGSRNRADLVLWAARNGLLNV